MEYTLTMTFITESGEKANFIISDVKENISEAEVKALMDEIIANAIFSNKKGAYVTKSAASVTQKQVTKFTI